MTTRDATPQTLTGILKDAQPGDTILLKPGEYAGSFGTPTAGNPERPITVTGNPETVFIGAKDSPLAWTVNAPYWHLRDFHILPTAPAKSGQKPTWIAVRSAGVGAALACLTLGRDGDIEKSKAWNDYGMVIEADATIVRECRLYGMTKPIHVKGPAIGVTITHNHIGPSYQSSIVLGTSFGSPMVGPLKWDDMPEPVEPETPPIVVEPPTEPVEPEPQPEESITLTGPPAAIAMLRAVVGALGGLSIEE